VPSERQRNPVPTVDVIIRTGGGIVLVRRKHPPLGWALPGGFVDAADACVFPPGGLPPLVFDHAQILADYLAGRY